MSLLFIYLELIGFTMGGILIALLLTPLLFWAMQALGYLVVLLIVISKKRAITAEKLQNLRPKFRYYKWSAVKHNSVGKVSHRLLIAAGTLVLLNLLFVALNQYSIIPIPDAVSIILYFSFFFALVVGIAIGYEHKTKGLFPEMELNQRRKELGG